MNTNVNMSNMDELQKENLRLLEAFVKFCDKYNVWYSLAFGSMLGAVRHNGMIPWDRDIDVYIKLEDIPFIRKHLDKELPENIQYLKRGVTDKYSGSQELLVSSVVDKAHLDMYPLVGAPSDEEEQKRFTKATYYLVKILKSKYVDIRKCLPKNRKLVFLAKCVDFFISDKTINKIYKKYEEKYNLSSAEYVVALVNYGKADDCMRKEIFDQVFEHDFEHLSCKIPVNYHEYLTRTYGDYMTPKRY